MKLQRTNGVCFTANAFLEMKRMRLLHLDHVQLTGDYGYLSQDLRWINWQGFPLKFMPDNFYQKNIVAFDLKHSNLKLLWKAPQVYDNDNSDCCHLPLFHFPFSSLIIVLEKVSFLVDAGVAKDPQSQSFQVLDKDP